MLKPKIHPSQLIFDIETVPCLETAARVYPELQEFIDLARATPLKPKGRGKKAPEPLSEDEINQLALTKLYDIAGATPDDPRPFLKFQFHKIVSISGISRKLNSGSPSGVDLAFFTLPALGAAGDSWDDSMEGYIIDIFFRGLGEKKPQLIGFYSTFFDIPCMLQRSLIYGKSSFPKLQRPDKPWEGADYFAKGSDYHIDLGELLCSRSPYSKATLNELARALRIPGKLGVSGADVASLWFEGKHREIIAYNECDTATTYLIWLEIMRLSGHVTGQDYLLEKDQFVKILRQKADEGATHFQEFLNEWDRLEGNDSDPDPPPIDDPKPSSAIDTSPADGPNCDQAAMESPAAPEAPVPHNVPADHDPFARIETPGTEVAAKVEYGDGQDSADPFAPKSTESTASDPDPFAPKPESPAEASKADQAEAEAPESAFHRVYDAYRVHNETECKEEDCTVQFKWPCPSCQVEIIGFGHEMALYAGHDPQGQCQKCAVGIVDANASSK